MQNLNLALNFAFREESSVVQNLLDIYFTEQNLETAKKINFILQQKILDLNIINYLITQNT
jgi:hypothetical protein